MLSLAAELTEQIERLDKQLAALRETCREVSKVVDEVRGKAALEDPGLRYKLNAVATVLRALGNQRKETL